MNEYKHLFFFGIINHIRTGGIMISAGKDVVTQGILARGINANRFSVAETADENRDVEEHSKSPGAPESTDADLFTQCLKMTSKTGYNHLEVDFCIQTLIGACGSNRSIEDDDPCVKIGFKRFEGDLRTVRGFCGDVKDRLINFPVLGKTSCEDYVKKCVVSNPNASTRTERLREIDSASGRFKEALPTFDTLDSIRKELTELVPKLQSSSIAPDDIEKVEELRERLGKARADMPYKKIPDIGFLVHKNIGGYVEERFQECRLLLDVAENATKRSEISHTLSRFVLNFRWQYEVIFGDTPNMVDMFNVGVRILLADRFFITPKLRSGFAPEGRSTEKYDPLTFRGGFDIGYYVYTASSSDIALVLDNNTGSFNEVEEDTDILRRKWIVSSAAQVEVSAGPLTVPFGIGLFCDVMDEKCMGMLTAGLAFRQ